eukprot:GFYU01009889.1.p1 GENE.GFYU01009889.1~~GFYU01009889.1.p1  ORF type:complete len:470 (-),score=108.31 GFYU01009889.1:116-1525(-)
MGCGASSNADAKEETKKANENGAQPKVPASPPPVSDVDTEEEDEFITELPPPTKAPMGPLQEMSDADIAAARIQAAYRGNRTRLQSITDLAGYADGVSAKLDAERPRLTACAVKFDHFENIYRLPKEIEGAPNFRKTDKFRVYGTGQPTHEGFKLVLRKLDASKVVWVNMRQEPVVYVNGNSFTPREKERLNENMEFPGIQGWQIERLQEDFVNQIREEAAAANNEVTYWYDTYAEHPDDRKNIEAKDTVQSPKDIMTLSEMYWNLRDAGFVVQYERLPIVDEKAPSTADFDKLTRIVKTAKEDRSFVFNCQMGKGRTTTGMVCACLVKCALANDFEVPGDPYTINEDAPDLVRGEFKVIRELCKVLDDGVNIKAHTDHIIDDCSKMQNLRECIMWTKERYEVEPTGHRQFWARMSVNFIERYFFLITYNAYLRQTKDDRFRETFHEWLDERMELQAMIDEAMESFEWA